jgi:hypothetical protein
MNGLLEDLIYRIFFISHDLSTVFYDFGYYEEDPSPGHSISVLQISFSVLRKTD